MLARRHAESGAASVVAGGYAFAVGVGAGQLAAAAAGLSCAVPAASSLAGAAVVLAAAAASQAAVLAVARAPRGVDMVLLETPEGRAWALAGTMAVFKALGGRFASVLPSDVLRPGAFARESIPAGRGHARPNQRAAIERLGRIHGCHTCGARPRTAGGARGSFHADHMPPTKLRSSAESSLVRRLLNRRVGQVFLPQCAPCSGLQARAARQWAPGLRRPVLRMHVSALRPYHAAGGLFAAVLVALNAGVAATASSDGHPAVSATPQPQ